MTWILWFYSCSTKLTTLPSPANFTLLDLVAKYKTEANILPKHKKIFFECTKLQYLQWSTKELQRWLGIARKIIRRYKLNFKKKVRSKINPNYSTVIDTNTLVSTSQLNHPTSHQYQHKVHRPPNNNHFKVSTITRFYPKTDTNLNPTSLDFNR